MACLMTMTRENVSFSVEDWVMAQEDDEFCEMILKRLQEEEITPSIVTESEEGKEQPQETEKSRTKKPTKQSR